MSQDEEIASCDPRSDSGVVCHIAAGFIQRADALGYKGKARDRAALDYFVGACTALEAAGRPTRHIKTIIALVIAPRGWSGVRAINRGEP